MDNDNKNTFLERFRRFPLWKKIAVVVGSVLAISVMLTVLKMMLFSYGVRTVTTSMGLQSARDNMRVPAMQEEMSFDSRGGMAKNDLARSTAPAAPSPSTGADAEEFEALRYEADIKGKKIEQACDAVEKLKPLQYVVFESAQRRDGFCSYDFKVERSQVNKIVEEINALNPYNFSSNTQTRKNQVIRFEGQLDILLQQQEMYKTYLRDTNREYERAISTAADAPNAQALATLLRDRQNIVEQINNKRINIASQLQNVSRSSAAITDSIEYVDFSVNAYKYEVFNVQAIKDSWVDAFGSFVKNANNIFQLLTVGILQLVLYLILVVVYTAVIFFVAVFSIRAGREVARSTLKRKEVSHEHVEHHEQHDH